MELRFSIITDRYEFENIESFTIDQDQHGKWSVTVDGEEVYKGISIPIRVEGTGFATKDLRDDRESTRSAGGESLDSDRHTLPRNIYEVAADDVAHDIIVGAGNKREGTESHHKVLKEMCRKHLSDPQLEKLGIESHEDPGTEPSSNISVNNNKAEETENKPFSA